MGLTLSDRIYSVGVDMVYLRYFIVMFTIIACAALANATTSVTNCSTLDTGQYTLDSDVSSEGNCFTFNGSNTDFNCQGYNINFSNSLKSNAIYATGINNLTVRNCKIWLTNLSQGTTAILFATVGTSLIYNNTITFDGNSAGINFTGAGTNAVTENKIYSPTTAYSKTGISVMQSAIINIDKNNITIGNTGSGNNYGIMNRGKVNATSNHIYVAGGTVNGGAKNVAIGLSNAPVDSVTNTLTSNNITFTCLSAMCSGFYVISGNAWNLYDNFIECSDNAGGSSYGCIYGYANLYNNTVISRNQSILTASDAGLQIINNKFAFYDNTTNYYNAFSFSSGSGPAILFQNNTVNATFLDVEKSVTSAPSVISFNDGGNTLHTWANNTIKVKGNGNAFYFSASRPHKILNNNITIIAGNIVLSNVANTDSAIYMASSNTCLVDNNSITITQINSKNYLGALGYRLGNVTFSNNIVRATDTIGNTFGTYFLAPTENTSYFNNNLFKVLNQSFIYNNGGVLFSTNYTNNTWQNLSSLDSIRIPSTIVDSVGNTIQYRNKGDFMNYLFNSSKIFTSTYPTWNVSAFITLAGLPYNGANPLVSYFDNATYITCPSNVCTKQSYSGGALVFNVSHFTTYAAGIALPVISLVNFTSDGGCTISGTCAETNTSDPNFIITTSDATACNSTWSGINISCTTADNISYNCLHTGDIIYGANTYTFQCLNLDGSSLTTSFNLTKYTPPPSCVILSRAPSDINDTSSGTFNVLLNCTSVVGINVTKTGDHYWAFATRTMEGYVTQELPNRWSIRPPSNNISSVDPLLSSYGQIFRAQGRGRGFWFESINNNLTGGMELPLRTWVLNDSYSYAVEDGHYGLLQLTNTSITNALFNYTSPSIRVSAFRQNIPLSYDSLVQEPKKVVQVYRDQQILVYRNDLEAMKGSQNYTITTFRNVNTTSLVPTASLRAFYCNSSYNPLGGVTVLASPNCVLINSITAAQLGVKVLTDRNSSYSQGFYSVTNGKIGTVGVTPYHYYYYDTLQTGTSRRYNYAYVNGSTVSNVTFAQTNRTWTSTNDGATWTSFPGTLDLMEFTTKANNDEFQFGYCIYDLAGQLGCNSTVIHDDITPTNHPISTPNFIEYNSSLTPDDFTLNGTHRGIMGILVAVSRDPDAVGAVTHNLTLRNVDGSYNLTINGSFKSATDSRVWIYFNTSSVSDGQYRLNISAFADDNPDDIESALTERNFTIYNHYPSLNVTLSEGITGIRWNVTFGTGTTAYNVQPTGQNSTIGFFRVMNNGTKSEDVYMRQTPAYPGVDTFCSNTSTFITVFNITPANTTIIYGLPIDSMQRIWCMRNYTIVPTKTSTTFSFGAD